MALNVLGDIGNTRKVNDSILSLHFVMSILLIKYTRLTHNAGHTCLPLPNSHPHVHNALPVHGHRIAAGHGSKYDVPEDDHHNSNSHDSIGKKNSSPSAGLSPRKSIASSGMASPASPGD